MEIDMILDHEQAKGAVETIGWDGFVHSIEQRFNYGFFSCSQDWYHSSKYICKLKGSRGDIIIGWKGVHAE